MKKFPLFVIFFVVWIGIFLLPDMFGYGGQQYLPERDYGYVINDYDINIVISEDKTMKITETITATFSEYSHGLVRYIPIEQTVSFFDDNNKLIQKNYKNSISNFNYLKNNSSDDTRLVSSENSAGYMFYRMGQDDGFVGTKTYSFSYDFDVGDDRISNKDLYYFNIIGTGWDTTIENVDFTVKFPTAIDSSGFKFYVGEYGEDKFGNDPRLSYAFGDNFVYGNVKNLAYGEAITVYNEFDEGYFKNHRSYIFDILLLLFVIGIAVGFVVFYIKHRKKHLIIETVEFEAPNGLTPAEVGYINDGMLTGDDISALIVYWASKGYVKLVQKEDYVEIVKIKDLSNNAKHHEKLFFNGLFKTSNIVNSLDLNIPGNLGSKIKNSVEKETKSCFVNIVDIFYNILSILTIVAFAFLVLKNNMQEYASLTDFILAMFLVVVVGVGLIVLPLIIKYKEKTNFKKFVLLFIIDLLAIFAAEIILSFVVESYSDAFGARFYLWALLAINVVGYAFLERYTEIGRQHLGKIRGLKAYIIVAEKDRIEMLAKENPELFYNILPYAYVLGVSDVFMKKFENVDIVKPDWYETDSFTDVYIAIRLFDSLKVFSQAIKNSAIRNSVKQIASSIRSGDGGSGDLSSGGGGFSGGGSGGGGGGRW